MIGLALSQLLAQKEVEKNLPYVDLKWAHLGLRGTSFPRPFVNKQRGYTKRGDLVRGDSKLLTRI